MLANVQCSKGKPFGCHQTGARSILAFNLAAVAFNFCPLFFKLCPFVVYLFYVTMR